MKVKEVEEVESERESVLNAISRVKENLQNVTQEIYAFESKGSNSGDSSTSSSSSYFDELQRDIRHKESEIQALRYLNCKFLYGRVVHPIVHLQDEDWADRGPSIVPARSNCNAKGANFSC